MVSSSHTAETTSSEATWDLCLEVGEAGSGTGVAGVALITYAPVRQLFLENKASLFIPCFYFQMTV